jgi:hypothetical protein
VRSSGPVWAYVAFLWLILPSGWPILLAVLMAALGTHGSGEKATEILSAALGLVSFGLFVAFMGRNAQPLPDGSGLRIRSFFRTFAVPWSDVLDVEGTEYQGGSRSFSFSKTIVTFRAAGKVSEVVVATSYRSGSAGAQAIQSWAPADHPIRTENPGRRVRVRHPEIFSDQPDRGPGMEDDAAPPAPAAPGVLIPDVLGPDPVNRRVMVGLGMVVAVVAGWRGIAFAADDGTPAEVGAVACAVAVVAGLLLAVRACGVKVELEPARLVNRGVFGTQVFAAADIHSFVAVSSGIGSVARVILNARGSRALAVGAGYGEYADQVVKTLTAWLAQAPTASSRR